MRFITASLIAAAAFGIALAAPVDKHGSVPASDAKPLSPTLVVDVPGQGRPGPVLYFDGDRDGFNNVVDCNDDSFDVNPIAAEIANGLDDDCDGVVDDGFDTSADLPVSPLSLALWPEIAIPGSPDLISMDTAPRVIWNGNGKAFIAVWIDVAERLRAARLGADGALIDNPPLVVRKSVGTLDAAWTGTRLGIVYEDVSASVPAVRLLTLDADLSVVSEALVAAIGTEPKIAWGQDRFGIVWKLPYGLDTLRFQTFDRGGVPFTTLPETLPNSGRHAAIAFSGGAMDLTKTPAEVHEGAFGIVYEAYYGYAVSGDVLLASRPRDPALGTAGQVRVNEHDDPYTAIGAQPGIAANPSGFAVCWHVIEAGAREAASLRFFALDTLEPVQEFAPDADAGRSGRMLWTGSEFVMANDNVTGGQSAGYDVHFRRVDPSGNTHLAAGWGPWTEVNLSNAVVGGIVSTHPDLANTGELFGVVWLERDPYSGGGQLRYAAVTHR